MEHIIEGDWEEIKRHEAEFAGQRLRVIISPPQKSPAKSDAASLPKSPRRISALGKYAGVLSSEEFMRRKQEDIAREDRTRLDAGFGR